MIETKKTYCDFCGKEITTEDSIDERWYKIIIQPATKIVTRTVTSKELEYNLDACQKCAKIIADIIYSYGLLRNNKEVCKLLAELRDKALREEMRLGEALTKGVRHTINR